MKNTRNNNRLRVVILTSAGRRLIDPIVMSQHQVVGIVDLTDDHLKNNIFLHPLRCLYWYLKEFRAPPTLERLSRECNASYFNFSPNTIEHLSSWLITLKADVLVVYKAPLIKADIFSIPKYGTINLHPSLLPKYRGGHPILWMAYYMDLVGGVSLNFISDKVDCGDLINQKSFSITPGMSEDKVEEISIYKYGIPLLIRALDDLSNGTCSRVRQPVNSPTPYARRLSNSKMWEMIEWDRWSLEHCWHFLRCNKFWKHRLPKFTNWKKYIDWKIENYIHMRTIGTPGEIIFDGNKMYFIHPSGYIEIGMEINLFSIIKKLISNAKFKNVISISE